MHVCVCVGGKTLIELQRYIDVYLFLDLYIFLFLVAEI